MRWFSEDDRTEPIITARAHIRSAHGDRSAPALPETCVLFEMGGALGQIQANHTSTTLAEALPCFLGAAKCVALDGHPRVCFVRGGLGAPAAVDVLETVLALGVRQVIVAGLCGTFAEGIEVGDVIVPPSILCEEGTSRHYRADPDFALPDPSLRADAEAFFGRRHRTHGRMTASTDAVYRQTFHKEARWRAAGCVGVDMEASALLNVCGCLGVPAAAVLLASDAHPLAPGGPPWGWGDAGFGEARERFVETVVAFAKVRSAAP